MINIENSRPRYSPADNILFITGKIFKFDKRLIVYCLLQIPAVVLIPLLSIYLSKVIVELVFQQTD
jgi:hypothetical protein